jgi:serine/threonine protein kinase
VLDHSLLKYYKGQGASGEGGELKGVINLPGATCEACEPHDEFRFQITPSSKKIYVIKAKDMASRDAWISAVRNNSKLALGAGGSMDGLPQEEPSPEDVSNLVKGANANVTLGDFELMKVIGRGTYGKVMQVRRRDTDEVFAMKVLKKEAIFARNDPKDLQHTIAERNVLALINTAEHPFILGLKFAFHTPAKLYYVLNFCNGGDLYYLLSRVKKFREAQARFYTAEIFSALQHLHSLGVIYRDLKPENVLLDGDGHIKLTDFGLSKESSTADTFCGTPVYLAPEIWLRKTYGFEVDWWSLGCVLYEMVTSLPPFWGDTIRDVYQKVIKTQPKFPTMSPECQSCIERLLNREPSQRLGSINNGADIKEHEFFAGLSWTDLLAKQIRPPFKSKSANQDDTQNFHRTFTQQQPIDSLSNPDAILSSEQEAHFDGFTYVPTADNPTTPAPSAPSTSRDCRESGLPPPSSPAASASAAPVPNAAPDAAGVQIVQEAAAALHIQ